MAKKAGSKETYPNESPEQRMSEQKQKISKIHDQFPQCTRDHISKILAYYKGDESEAIYAITKDGGQEALTNSLDIESTKTKNNRNKKKKKKSKKEMVVPSASFDADDSSSLHSSSNVDIEVEKDSSKIEEGVRTMLMASESVCTLSTHEEISTSESSFDDDLQPHKSIDVPSRRKHTPNRKKQQREAEGLLDNENTVLKNINSSKDSADDLFFQFIAEQFKTIPDSYEKELCRNRIMSMVAKCKYNVETEVLSIVDV